MLTDDPFHAPQSHHFYHQNLFLRLDQDFCLLDHPVKILVHHRVHHLGLHLGLYLPRDQLLYPRVFLLLVDL
jgi:hypothetical protein